MNFFPRTFLKRHQLKLFFLSIWLHISVLDLFYVTYRGPVFMWHENGQWLTVFVHFSIALSTAGLYWVVNKRVSSKRKSKMNTRLNTSFIGKTCDINDDDEDHSNMTKIK